MYNINSIQIQLSTSPFQTNIYTVRDGVISYCSHSVTIGYSCVQRINYPLTMRSTRPNKDMHIIMFKDF